ncbi:hypothetical protein OF83DRAFT_435980 [Amylostereum chailletii]|nr:hypothetical protein OF83DRAFT_435980 [Amylostereum chailletii]
MGVTPYKSENGVIYIDDVVDVEKGEPERGTRKDRLTTTHKITSRAHHRLRLVIGVACLAAVFYISIKSLLTHSTVVNCRTPVSHLNGTAGLCPQVSPIFPSKHADLTMNIDVTFGDEGYKTWAIENLGGAVRIPTETYDDIGRPGSDPRWNTRLVLHEYLERRFPLVHKNLERTKVNTLALVFHWQGSNYTLKPILLAAHQDVVPVHPDTVDQWIHPPYSGYYDGTWIWGRGSCDDKSGLIGSLTAVETLLKARFKPTRSIVLAFGIDEERGGVDGARYIKDHLLEKYGRGGFSMLVDEGGQYEDKGEIIISTPNVAEKGKLNVRVEISTPGGHSSVPPPHTGIGYLSSIITALEDHPLPASLKRNGTYFRTLQCSAAHDLSFPPSLRNLVKSANTNDQALQDLRDALLAKDERGFRAITGTTQAVDLIGGGVKVNALPETSWAVVDHRIADYSSVAELQARYVDVLAPVASALNLTFDAFGTLIPRADGTSLNGHLRLTDAYGTALNPAPVSPTDGSGPWELLSGTILSTLGSSLRPTMREKSAIVAPGLVLGNTDTRHYWNLTKHIFRYNHMGSSDRYNGAHTINEAIKAEGFLEMVRFFTRLILNADETPLLDN